MVDSASTVGDVIFGAFTELSGFDRVLVAEQAIVSLTAACAMGCKGGRPFKMAAFGLTEMHVGMLCQELGSTRHMMKIPCLRMD